MLTIEREPACVLEPAEVAAIRAAGVRTVAERAGLSTAYVSQWLHAKRRLPLSSAVRVLEAAGVPTPEGARA